MTTPENTRSTLGSILPKIAIFVAAGLLLVFVLMEVDFPHQKYISPQTALQNDALAKKYEIEGFPTIIVLNAEGKTVGRFMYGDGGPQVLIDALKALPKA